MRLPPLPTVRDLVKLYKLRAIKQLSQNFLMDQRITDRIVKAAGNLNNQYVLEVGPGPGSITRSILRQSPRKLILVEKDSRFLPTLELLKEAVADSVQIDIEINDILDYNFCKGFEGAPTMNWYHALPPIHLIGNLPFNVSTHLIIRWLQAVSEKRDAWSFGRTPMTLTFQKEVAERIVAPLAHKQRCRLSVMCQMWCDVKHKFTIPGTAFVPKPDVDVGVVTLYPLKYPLVKLPFKLVEKVVTHIFNMRQKYCSRGAANLFPEDVRSELVNKLFHLADINPETRPFQLSNEEFARLAYAYNAILEENQDIADYNHRAPKRKIVEAA